MTPRPRTSRALALLAAALLAASASAQTVDPRDAAPLPLPSIVDDDAVRALTERIAPAVFAVRTSTDLGPRFRPRISQGSGAATLLRISPDEPPVLVTAYAYIARATRVEVRVDGVWYDATIAHATPMFDLTALELPVPLAADRALPLAEAWSLGGTVVCPGDVIEQDVTGVVFGAMGAAPEDDYAFYVRGVFTHHHGYPIVGLDGRVLAITSFMAPDRHGGVFAIPFGHVATWQAEWEQLAADSPIGWEPRVRVTPVDVHTGRETLPE